MSRIGDLSGRVGAKLGGTDRLSWLILTLFLTLPLSLARIIEPVTMTVFKQLTALYALNSLLFFFTHRFHAKIGSLTLIFLATMEVIVIIYYLLTLYSGSVSL